MEQNRIHELLNDFGLTEVYFGSEGFRVSRAEDVPDGQIGYSRHPDGTDLIGTNEGDWQKNWIVIGYDTSLGDPYFVDASKKDLPVFTAMHGMGSWEPEQICRSLDRFLKCLKVLASVSPVDHARIDPDHTTITDEETLVELERKLVEISGESHFWGNFLERHREWIGECDC